MGMGSGRGAGLAPSRLWRLGLVVLVVRVVLVSPAASCGGGDAGPDVDSGPFPTGETDAAPFVPESSRHWPVSMPPGRSSRGSEERWSGEAAARTDVNGDGTSDLIWQANDGSVEVWFMDASQPTETRAYLAEDLGWLQAVGDWDGDGRAELLFHHRGGTFTTWDTDAGAEPAASSWSYNPNDWRLFGVGDTNRDGYDDLVFQAPEGSVPADCADWDPARCSLSWGAGQVLIALMEGGSEPTGFVVLASEGRHVQEVADVNGDGRADILLRGSDGALRFWLMDQDPFGTPRIGGRFTAVQHPSWKLQGAGDLDGNGAADLVFQYLDGTVGLWLLSRGDVDADVGVIGATQLPQETDMRVQAVQDVSGDGRADLIFRAGPDVLVWEMDGTERVRTVSLSRATRWKGLSQLLVPRTGQRLGAQGVLGAQVCDLIVRSTDPLELALADLPTTSTEQVLCVAPGSYEGHVELDFKHALTVAAPLGGVTFTSETATDAAGAGPYATVTLRYVEDLAWRGVDVVNRHRFTFERPSSAAFAVHYGRAVELSHATVEGFGKRTLVVERTAGFAFRAGELRGAYFVLAPEHADVAFEQSVLRADLTEYPGDLHSIVWAGFSNHAYRDCTFVLESGRSLVSGINDFTTHRIVLRGTTVHGGANGLHSWIQQHPVANNGLYVELFGDYPEDVADYYLNPSCPTEDPPPYACPALSPEWRVERH